MTTTADEFLAHYGVKGMKWGVRRKSSDGAVKVSRKQRRNEKNQEILQARYRQQIRERKFEEAQGDFFVARTRKGQDKAEQIMRKMEKEYFTNPDAKTAQKMTTAEKWTVGVAYGAIGLMAIGMGAAATEAGR